MSQFWIQSHLIFFFLMAVILAVFSSWPVMSNFASNSIHKNHEDVSARIGSTSHRGSSNCGSHPKYSASSIISSHRGRSSQRGRFRGGRHRSRGGRYNSGYHGVHITLPRHLFNKVVKGYLRPVGIKALDNTDFPVSSSGASHTRSSKLRRSPMSRSI